MRAHQKGENSKADGQQTLEKVGVRRERSALLLVAVSSHALGSAPRF